MRSVSRREGNRYVLAIFLFAFVVLLITGCNWKWGHIGYDTGYAPDQPLPFSHEIHAGQYKMDCLYCHTNVENAAHAAVPSLNICMNCHIVVAADKPAIQELQAKFFAGEPIAWKNVHRLPDHVKFKHYPHVNALSEPDNRYQACQTCHGPVAEMQVVEQVSPLSMGWCVNCHREPENNAPTNCSTCHY